MLWLLIWLCLFGTAQAVESNRADVSFSAPKEYRIIGGVEVPSDERHWVAAIVLASFPVNQGFFCAGSLIHPRWVLTAAHCLQITDPDLEEKIYKNPKNIEVVVNINSLEAENGERIKVKRIIPHPDFAEKLVPDIALIELEKDSTVVPIPIYSGSHNLKDVYGTVLGWGRTAIGGSLSNRLRQVELPIIDNDDCSALMSEVLGEDNIITSWEMCAGYREGLKDACYGDSGGPLLVQIGDQWRLAGIVSWGEECGIPGRYGIYTRVNKCVGFINEHLVWDISQLHYGHDDDFNCFISNTFKTSR